ncbi:MAG: hypothetical protein GX825_07425, partial [Syntrophomonadaceae bacterium]|nr:hypothetical protein [Syntrophomonadaceae bacterium]
MQNPRYRISTYCPQGMSPTLKTYLSQLIDEEMTTADVIAANLLGPFQDTDLPFACTFVGWSSEHNEEQLENLFAKLNDLTISSSQQKISLEILTVTLNGGCLLVAGAYPLLDLHQKQIEAEYQNVSFILNRHVVEDMIDWIQGTMINGLLETDKIGVICTVLGDSEKLLDKKMKEILSLLQVTGVETGEKLTNLSVGIDDLHVSLAF